MRALIAALIFMLAVAVTASIFAMWPVVGDAPWEDDVPIVQDGTNELRCEEALERRRAATWVLGDLGIRGGQYTMLQNQLEQAQREIDRYC